MIQAVFQFIAKAAPRFVGAMMKPGRKAQAYYRLAAQKFSKTKVYEKMENFLGEKPGSFMKDCARDAVKQTTTNLMFGAMMGAANKIMSGGTKMLSFPKRISGNVGGMKAPGINSIQAAQTTAVKSFNSVSRVLTTDKSALNEQRKKQSRIIDRYKKSFQKKNFSMGEIATLGQKLEVDLQKQKGKLTRALKDGDKTLVGMANIKQPQRIPVPNVPAEQKDLAEYTKQALEQTNQQMVDNIKAVNENLKRSLVTMQRKQEDISQRMMSNLGNYNSVAMSKLADTVTKAEETSFKRQQESSFYQTELLSEKMDASHDYSSKQADALRAEVAATRQTIYDVDKQDRMIDDQYRMLEERRNKGVTLATLAGMLQSTAGMVQQGLKTPDVINENVKHAMEMVAKTAGEEVGRLIQILKNLLDGFRTTLYKVHNLIPWPFRATVRPIIGLLDWVNDKIFRGLLGADDSTISDYFGTPMSLSDMLEWEHAQSDDMRSYAESSGQMNYVAGANGIVRTQAEFNEAAKTVYKGKNIEDIHTKIMDKKVQVMTKSGYVTMLDNDRQVGESEADFLARKKAEALDEELDAPFTMIDVDESRASSNRSANDYYRKAEALINNEKVIRDDAENFETVYRFESTRVSDEFHTETSIPAEYPQNFTRANATHKEFVSAENNPNKTGKNTFYEYFRLMWSGNKEVKLNTEVSMRVMKMLKIARERGIRFKVTSIMRPPAVARTSGTPINYLSEHNLGLAVDISIDTTPHFSSMSEVVSSYCGEPQSPDLLFSQLNKIIETGGKVLSDGPKKDYAFMYLKQWFDFLSLCEPQGLTFGSTAYPHSATGEKPPANDLRDLVHICLSKQRNLLDSTEAHTKNIFSENAELNKAVGNVFQNWGTDINKNKAKNEYNMEQGKINRKDVIGEVMKAAGNVTAGKEKITTFEGIEIDSPIDTHYYTDDKGKKYKVSEYMMNEKGEIVAREDKDKMMTDAGNIIADMIRQGKLTPELKQAIEDYYETTGKKSGNVQERDDLANIINSPTFNVTTHVQHAPSASYSDMGNANSEQL